MEASQFYSFRSDKIDWMTVTNHILAGALIGISVKEPVLALPLAFLSHFLMDALPHFGYPGNKGFGEALKHRVFYKVGIFTLISSIGVVALLIVNSLWVALLAGLMAAAPDIFGVYNYRKYEKLGLKSQGLFYLFQIKFHRAIQWCERPWGIYVEASVFMVLLLVMSNQI